MKRSLVLFEDDGFVRLLPLVYWRSVFELQVGRKVFMDRLAQKLGLAVRGVWVRDWLARVAAQRCGAPANQPIQRDTVLANGRWLVEGPVEIPAAPVVGKAGDEVAYVVCDGALAERLGPDVLLDPGRRDAALSGIPTIEAPGRMLRHPWEVIATLSDLLERDWKPADAAIETDLHSSLSLEQPERIHIGERTSVHPSIVLDASTGTIFISHDVRIGPGAVLEGPLYIGPGSHVHPHAWLHGGNAIGPMCRVGGEVVGCVLHGYTNKQHAGFLGHSYVGGWVNIGAGATNSNLKNTYGKVRVPVNGQETDSGLQFFGAILGDFAKIGINAAIPTGAVVGMSASIASTRTFPKFIPSYSWVTDEGVATGDPLRLLDAATAAMARRQVDMTDDEVELFLELPNRTRMFERGARENG